MSEWIFSVFSVAEKVACYFLFIEETIVCELNDKKEHNHEMSIERAKGDRMKRTVFNIQHNLYELYHRLYSLQATVMSIRMISAYFQKLLSIHCKSNLANVRDLNTPFKSM